MDPIDFEKVTLREAKAIIAERNESTVKPSSHASWDEKRKPLSSFELDLQEDTYKWMATLPEKVQPWKLGRQFPRIANKLALVWGMRAECERELDDLLMDKRGNRKGFPRDVAHEIMALKLHFNSEHQEQTPTDWTIGLERRIR